MLIIQQSSGPRRKQVMDALTIESTRADLKIRTDRAHTHSPHEGLLMECTGWNVTERHMQAMGATARIMRNVQEVTQGVDL